MKKHYSTIILTVCFGFITCNSPEGPTTTSNDQTAVTVALIAKTLAQSTYKITITGSGMETIGPNEYAGGQTIELYVPVGKARTFHFERYNTGGILIDTGTTISDIGAGMNNAVSISLTAAIAAPTITIQPAAQAVVEGTTATFTISAIGTDLKYQWQKGTANINGATSVAYTTPVLSLSDAAVYRCVVINPAGSVTSNEAVLAITAAIIAPAITTQPSDQTITAGQTATFTIAATGSDLKYQWQKGTVPIEGALYPIYTVPITVTSDSGSTYTCVVSNSAGTTQSNLAMLRVTTIIIAPAIAAQPSAQTVTEGQGVTFIVVATGTNLNYQWQKDRENIPGATFAALVVQATKFAENGAAFRCIVSNSAGSQTSNEGILTVQPAIIAPSILNHPEDQSVTEEQTATFTIAATGTELQFQWQKGTTDIFGATGSSYTTSPNPMSENNATFRCVVSNTTGSLTSDNARLTIVQKVVAPVINVHPSDKAVPEDQVAFFSVVAVGTNLKFQWQKGTTDIPNATNASYTTPPTTMNDTNATFRCVVSNSTGSVSSNYATLTLLLKDHAAPVITLLGRNPDTTFGGGTAYKNPGATAFDNKDGDVTAKITVSGIPLINLKKFGKYTISYNCADLAGNSSSLPRTIQVVPDTLTTDLFVRYLVPLPDSLPTIGTNMVFTTFNVDGDGPVLDSTTSPGLTKVTFTWINDANNKQFQLQFNYKQTPYNKDFNSITKNFNTDPSIMLAGTLITGLDGKYYVTYDTAKKRLIWVRQDKSFAIILTR